ATMMTGLAPSQHGLRTNGQQLDPSIPTLAGMFERAGWDTAAVTAVGFLGGAATGFGEVRADRRGARDVTNEAIDLLRGREASRPLFLWIHYYDVHGWQSERKVRGGRKALRAATRIEGRAWMTELARMHGWPTRSDGTVLFEPPHWGLIRRDKKMTPQPFYVTSGKDATKWIDRYDALLASVDRHIARLFDTLAKEGPTLAILTSDHGEGLGGHGALGHGRYLYDEQLHVPLIVFTTDDSLPTRTVAELVSLTDLAPTIAELLGGPGGTDPQLAGSSFAPSVRGGTLPRRPLAFAERRPRDELRIALGWKYESMHSVQTPTHKYIAIEGGPHEFYDLARDPRELDNLIASDHPARKELRSLLEAYIAKLRSSDREAVTNESFVEELRALGYVR
ncbi:MAG: sulfatase-like hydrolase/transferase, partial [bacterium]|nr:sulfatase-like hydrolase/transferase [bacterium]